MIEPTGRTAAVCDGRFIELDPILATSEPCPATGTPTTPRTCSAAATRPSPPATITRPSSASRGRSACAPTWPPATASAPTRYLELGDRVRALNDLDHAIRLKPDDPQAYADRAAELFIQKSFDQAIADCDRVLKLDPGRAPMYGLRGRCHADRGDTESALQGLRDGHRRRPRERPALPALAGAAPPRLRQLRRRRRRTSPRRLAATRTTPRRYYTRGTVRQQHGDSAGAVERLHRGARPQARPRLRPAGPGICRLDAQGLCRRRRRLRPRGRAHARAGEGLRAARHRPASRSATWTGRWPTSTRR